jgi:hypothetical protein
MENSMEAGASEVKVTVRNVSTEPEIVLVIEDNGRGMDPEFARRVIDPFVTTRTTRKVGLGIPLLLQTAQACGGDLLIESEKGRGTKVTASFRRDNIDRPPLGDMAQTISVALATNPGVRLVYSYQGSRGEFLLDSHELKERLGDVPVTDPAVVQWVKEYIKEREASLGGEPV